MRSNLGPLIAGAGMSRRSFAQLMGVHVQSIYRWCDDEGIDMLALRKAEEVASALGCDVKDLFDERPACGGVHIGFRVEEPGKGR